MKVNWGTSIIIAFTLFIVFIMYFVIKVQTDSKYDNELVVDQYYKHDIHFSEEMIRIQNAQNLKEKPFCIENNNEIIIIFPSVFNPKKITGIVSLYRPSNKTFDFDVPISLTNNKLLIPKSKLITGRWNVNMEWSYNGKAYLTKINLNLKS
jgi:hypothetical protein